MLIIQSQRPEAAGEDFKTISGVKVSSARTSLIALKFLAGILSASTSALKPRRISRNCYGLAMRERAVAHGFSVFNLPTLSTGTLG